MTITMFVVVLLMLWDECSRYTPNNIWLSAIRYYVVGISLLVAAGMFEGSYDTALILYAIGCAARVIEKMVHTVLKKKGRFAQSVAPDSRFVDSFGR